MQNDPLKPPCCQKDTSSVVSIVSGCVTREWKAFQPIPAITPRPVTSSPSNYPHHQPLRNPLKTGIS
ncbi:unnamed protein product [Diplocarpon coronariae]